MYRRHLLTALAFFNLINILKYSKDKYFDMKKVNDIQAKRDGCKTCPPVSNKYQSSNKQKINVSKRNED